MDCFGAARLSGLDDASNLQIAVLSRCRADGHRFVAQRDVTGIDIGVGIHGNRLYAKPPRRRRNTASDFATVSYEDFFEHE